MSLIIPGQRHIESCCFYRQDLWISIQAVLRTSPARHQKAIPSPQFCWVGNSVTVNTRWIRPPWQRVAMESPNASGKREPRCIQLSHPLWTNSPGSSLHWFLCHCFAFISGRLKELRDAPSLWKRYACTFIQFFEVSQAGPPEQR